MYIVVFENTSGPHYHMGRDTGFSIFSWIKATVSGMEWRHTTSPVKVKAKRAMLTRKIMATVLWDRHGVLIVGFMPQGTILNWAYWSILWKLRHVAYCHVESCCFTTSCWCPNSRVNQMGKWAIHRSARTPLPLSEGVFRRSAVETPMKKWKKDSWLFGQASDIYNVGINTLLLFLRI